MWQFIRHGDPIQAAMHCLQKALVLNCGRAISCPANSSPGAGTTHPLPLPSDMLRACLDAHHEARYQCASNQPSYTVVHTACRPPSAA
jgi:hypothetical protein